MGVLIAAKEAQRLKATERGFRMHYEVYRPRDVWIPYEAITEVAYLCGFSDASYFSKVFRRFAGVCPSEYAEDTACRDILSDERLALIL